MFDNSKEYVGTMFNLYGSTHFALYAFLSLVCVIKVINICFSNEEVKNYNLLKNYNLHTLVWSAGFYMEY